MLQSGQLRALPCPACGSIASHAHLFRKNGCEILRCMECGLGRAEARDFEPTTYYTQEYFSGGHADGYANYLGAERVLRREFARTVRFIRRHCDGGRLLELPTTHSLGLAARAALDPRAMGPVAHVYFHDTDLLRPSRRLALSAALAALARRRVPLDLDRLADEAAAQAPEKHVLAVPEQNEIGDPVAVDVDGVGTGDVR